MVKEVSVGWACARQEGFEGGRRVNARTSGLRRPTTNVREVVPPYPPLLREGATQAAARPAIVVGQLSRQLGIDDDFNATVLRLGLFGLVAREGTVGAVAGD